MELIEAGHEAVVVANYVNSSPEAMARVRALTGAADFPVYRADLCDREPLRTIFREQKIDAVIHFARSGGGGVGRKARWFISATIWTRP